MLPLFPNTTTTTTTDVVVEDETITPALPDHTIMEEILPRLPVKSLLRFKSVSKFWLFTISHNPHFAKLHLNFSSALRPQFFMMNFSQPFFGMTDTCFLLPYQDCSNATDLVGLGNRFVVDWSHWTRIVNSCNGLVCLYNRFIDDKLESELERYCYFTVWNPATRQFRDIHSPPGLNMALAYGFGYVSSIDDYKIVASFATENGDKHVFCGFYVFSMRDGNWRRIVGKHNYLLRFRKGQSKEELLQEKIANKLYDYGVLIDDTLYWPQFGRTNYIVGFNLGREELKEYSSTNLECGYDSVQLYRLKGCLALHGWKHFGESDFWILKNIEDWSSWQKLFTVELKRVHLITLSDTGKCLVRHSEQFKLVDLSKETLESVEGYEFSECTEKAMDYVESLVSPFGMSNAR